jgi:putative transposase
MFLNCPPTLCPSGIMHQIKGYTSKILIEEFVELSKIPGLWTRSYFVSTSGNACSETIKKYVESQKKSY